MVFIVGIFLAGFFAGVFGMFIWASIGHIIVRCPKCATKFEADRFFVET